MNWDSARGAEARGDGPQGVEKEEIGAEIIGAGGSSLAWVDGGAARYEVVGDAGGSVSEIVRSQSSGAIRLLESLGLGW